MPRTFEDFIAFAAPAVFVVLWSSGFVFAKLGLPYVEPLTFLALRMGAAVVLLAFIIVLTRPKWPGRVDFVHSAVTGLMMHGLYLGGVFIALENGISAGFAALFVSLQPLLTSTIANGWLGERVMARQWLGLALGLFGVYLVLRERTAIAGATPLAWSGLVAALIGITVGTLYQKRFGSGMDWRPALAAQYTAAGLLFALGAFAFETHVVHWTPQFLIAISYLALVLSFGTIWLFYYLIRHTSATRVTSLFYLVPPTTALMAWALFGERLTPFALVGMAVCVGGVALVVWRPTKFASR